MKTLIHRGGHLLLVVADCILSRFRVLPVHNTAVLLFALIFLRSGLMPPLGRSRARGWNRSARFTLSVF